MPALTADECDIHEMSYCGICSGAAKRYDATTGNLGSTRTRSDVGIAKADILAQIAGLLSLPVPRLSEGSTEPRQFLIDVAARLNIPVPAHADKPGVVAAVLAAADRPFPDSGSSTGSTVTATGLLALREATDVLLAARAALTARTEADAEADEALAAL